MRRPGDEAIARQGIQYLSVCCIFSLGLFTQTMGEKLLAATGRTYLSMISQLTGAVVNIILDPIFIFGYCGEALSGTTGAAVATVIGQFCGAGMTLFFNLNKNPWTSRSASRASGPVQRPSAVSTRWACPASPCSAWAA